MTDIRWDGKTMAYAKAHVGRGVLDIDDHGHIWRHLAWYGGAWRSIAPRRAESEAGNGYLKVALGVPGGRVVAVKAHRLVYEVKIGAIPEGLEINHRNLDKHDNRPDNLELVTSSGNIQHSYANGRTRPWSTATQWRDGRPRLTDEQITAVRVMRARGAKLREVAEQFGISTTHAHRITGDIRWRKE